MNGDFRSSRYNEPSYLFEDGIMGLPGAASTVANPFVAQNLADMVAKTETPPIPQGPEVRSVPQDQQELSLAQLYQNVLGRAPDTGGLDYWTKEIGPTADAAEIERFTQVAAPELKAKDVYGKYVTGYDATQEQIDQLRQQFAAPGAQEQDILRSFLNPADTKAAADHMFLMQADPDYIAAQQGFRPTVDTSALPKFEGRPYDPNAYENISKQLSAQQQALEQQAGFKYGSTFGGAQETIADMAKRLAASGISDIRDFGQRYSVVAEPVYETIPGDEGGYQTFNTGKYRTITGIEGYTGEGEPIYKYRELTPSEMQRLKFDDEGMAFLDATKKDIEQNPFAESVYYNKKTGEIIDKQKIGGKAESGIWGSSGAGEGYTNYRVQYTDEGIPIFYPEKERSGMKEFVAESLPGILSVLRFIPGASIPVMLAQAAAANYMGAKPEDILKQVGTTLLASNLDKIAPAVFKQVGMELPTTDLGKMAYRGGLGALSSLIQGGDLESAIKSGALSAGATGISGLLPTPKEGDLNYERILRALAPAIARGQLSNADVMRLLMASATPTKKKEPGKP